MEDQSGFRMFSNGKELPFPHLRLFGTLGGAFLLGAICYWGASGGGTPALLEFGFIAFLSGMFAAFGIIAVVSVANL